MEDKMQTELNELKRPFNEIHNQSDDDEAPEAKRYKQSTPELPENNDTRPNNSLPSVNNHKEGKLEKQVSQVPINKQEKSVNKEDDRAAEIERKRDELMEQQVQLTHQLATIKAQLENEYRKKSEYEQAQAKLYALQHQLIQQEVMKTTAVENIKSVNCPCCCSTKRKCVLCVYITYAIIWLLLLVLAGIAKQAELKYRTY